MPFFIRQIVDGRRHGRSDRFEPLANVILGVVEIGITWEPRLAHTPSPRVGGFDHLPGVEESLLTLFVSVTERSQTLNCFLAAGLDQRLSNTTLVFEWSTRKVAANRVADIATRERLTPDLAFTRAHAEEDLHVGVRRLIPSDRVERRGYAETVLCSPLAGGEFVLPLFDLVRPAVLADGKLETLRSHAHHDGLFNPGGVLGQCIVEATIEKRTDRR